MDGTRPGPVGPWDRADGTMGARGTIGPSPWDHGTRPVGPWDLAHGTGPMGPWNRDHGPMGPGPWDWAHGPKGLGPWAHGYRYLGTYMGIPILSSHKEYTGNV